MFTLAMKPLVIVTGMVSGNHDYTDIHADSWSISCLLIS